MEIKYHLDESVAHAIANGLEHRGIDVSISLAAGLIGLLIVNNSATQRSKAAYLLRTMMISRESMLTERSMQELCTYIRNV